MGLAMKGLRSAFKDVSDAAKGSGKDVSKGAGELTGWSKAAAAVGGGVAIGTAAVIASSVKAASDYQEATVRIQNSMGISQRAAEDLGNAFIGTMGKSTFSAQQIAEAFAPVAGEFDLINGRALTTKQSLDVMRQAMDLSEASGQDLNTTTKNLADVMAAYHVPIKNASDATNTLYNTSRLTGQTVDEVSRSMSQLSPRVAGTGVTVQTMGGFMVELTKAMGNGRMAIRQAGTDIESMVSPSSAAQKALAQLGISFTDSQGKFVGLPQAMNELNGALSKLPATSNSSAVAQQELSIKQRILQLQMQETNNSTSAQIKQLELQASAMRTGGTQTQAYLDIQNQIASLTSQASNPAIKAQVDALRQQETAMRNSYQTNGQYLAIMQQVATLSNETQTPAIKSQISLLKQQADEIKNSATHSSAYTSIQQQIAALSTQVTNPAIRAQIDALKAQEKQMRDGGKDSAAYLAIEQQITNLRNNNSTPAIKQQIAMLREQEASLKSGGAALDRNAALQAIFGKNGQAVNQILQQGSGALSKYTEQVSKEDSAHAAAERAAQTFAGQMKTLRATFDDLKIVIGNAFLPVISQLLKDITPIVSEIGNFIGKHKELTAVLIGSIGAIGAATAGVLLMHAAFAKLHEAAKIVGMFKNIGKEMELLKLYASAGKDGVVEAFGKMKGAMETVHLYASVAKDGIVSAFSKVGGALKTVGEAFTGMARAAIAAIPGMIESITSFSVTIGTMELTLGPILLIVTAIAALGFGIYELATHWSAVWKAVKDAVQDAWKFITGIIGDIVGWIKKHWMLLLEIFTAPFAPLIAIFLRFHDQIIHFVSDMVATVARVGKDMWHWITEGLGAAFGFVRGVFTDIVSFVSGIPGDLLRFGDQMWHWILDGLNAVWSGVKAVWNTIIGFVEAIPKAFVNLGKKLWSWIVDYLKLEWDGVQAVWKAITDFITAIPKVVVGMGKKVWSWFLDGLNDVWRGVQAVWKTVDNFFTGIPKDILSAIGAVGSLLLKVGKDIISGLWSGIKTAYTDVSKFFTNLGADVLNFFKDAGSWLLKAGKAIIEGLVNGIKNAAGDVTHVMGKVAGSIEHAITHPWSIFSPSRKAADIGGYIIQGLNLGLLGTPISTRFVDAFTSDVSVRFNFMRAEVVNDVKNVMEAINVGFTAGGVSATASIDKLAASLNGSMGSALKNLRTQLNTTLGPSFDGLSSALSPSGFTAGVSFAQGLINGLAASQAAVNQTAVNIGQGLVNTMKNTLGIHSPSTITAEMGGNVVEGLNQGMSKTPVQTVQMTQQLLNQLKDLQDKVARGGSSTATITAQINSVEQQLAQQLGLGPSGGAQMVAPTSFGNGSGTPGGPTVTNIFDLRGSQVMSDRDMDLLVGKIGQRLATSTLTRGGLIIRR